MDTLIDAEFGKWRDRQSAYLGLPYDLFRADCPPLLVIGGGSLNSAVPPIVVVSLEPLYDHRTFAKQVEFISLDQPRYLGRYRKWQLSYFSQFPELIRPRNSTAYWGDMAALVGGWGGSGQPKGTPWTTLGAAYLEIPLIPTHAKKHTELRELPVDAQDQVRKLFRERLRIVLDTYAPAAVLALGADCVVETKAALQSSDGRPVPLAAYQPAFGKVRERYERTIEAVSPRTAGGPTVFLRRAPYSNWHRPNRIGIHATGVSLRAFASAATK